MPAQSRLIATILATFVCLSPSAASELPTTMPPFTGEVITLHEGANTFDLTSQGPHGLVIVATYPEYFPNDHSLILTMASTKMADGVSETSEIVPVSDFKFLGGAIEPTISSAKACSSSIRMTASTIRRWCLRASRKGMDSH